MPTTSVDTLSLGQKAPAFALPDSISGSTISSPGVTETGKGLLVAFLCNHCPYVVHVLDRFTQLARQFQDSGVTVIAISSNDVQQYPDDAPEKMKELGIAKNFSFPYLFDESQDVARSYGAMCTPEFFLFDSAHQLVYHGQFDETRPNQGLAHGKDLEHAVQILLTGAPFDFPQRAAVGCGIKWKL